MIITKIINGKKRSLVYLLAGLMQFKNSLYCGPQSLAEECGRKCKGNLVHEAIQTINLLSPRLEKHGIHETLKRISLDFFKELFEKYVDPKALIEYITEKVESESFFSCELNPSPKEEVISFYKKKIENGYKAFQSIVEGFGLKFTISYAKSDSKVEIKEYIGLLELLLDGEMTIIQGLSFSGIASDTAGPKFIIGLNGEEIPIDDEKISIALSGVAIPKTQLRDLFEKDGQIYENCTVIKYPDGAMRSSPTGYLDTAGLDISNYVAPLTDEKLREAQENQEDLDSLKPFTGGDEIAINLLVNASRIGVFTSCIINPEEAERFPHLMTHILMRFVMKRLVSSKDINTFVNANEELRHAKRLYELELRKPEADRDSDIISRFDKIRHLKNKATLLVFAFGTECYADGRHIKCSMPDIMKQILRERCGLDSLGLPTYCNWFIEPPLIPGPPRPAIDRLYYFMM